MTAPVPPKTVYLFALRSVKRLDACVATLERMDGIGAPEMRVERQPAAEICLQSVQCS